MRALWLREGSPFKGEFYSTEGVVLEPYHTQQPGRPIWIGSWGSETGLRRTARLGDGWLLPTTPPRKGSPTPGDDSQNTYTPQARILTDSPMQ